jgi:SPP1 gp7 family putative phage head morphogenesis protein
VDRQHPDVGTSADPARFEQAIAWFRRRVPMSPDAFDELDAAQQDYAWTVAGVAQADVVMDVWDAIDSAIEAGDSFDDFQAAIGDQLDAAWGRDQPGRLETIFRTNVNSAYNAGRQAIFSSPAVKEARPYLRYDAIDDDRTDEDCEDADGTVKEQDDGWWLTHTPPLHPNCRCSFVALSPEEAREEGIDDAGDGGAGGDDGFGGPADDDGTPDWQPDLGDYPSAIADVLGEILAP